MTPKKHIQLENLLSNFQQDEFFKQLRHRLNGQLRYGLRRSLQYHLLEVSSDQLLQSIYDQLEEGL